EGGKIAPSHHLLCAKVGDGLYRRALRPVNFAVRNAESRRPVASPTKASPAGPRPRSIRGKNLPRSGGVDGHLAAAVRLDRAAEEVEAGVFFLVVIVRLDGLFEDQGIPLEDLQMHLLGAVR